MPRILLFFEYPSINGGERSILATIDIVRQAGFEVEAAAPPVGDLGSELAVRDVKHWPLDPTDGNRRRDLREIRSDIAALIHRARPHIVHANSLSMARIAGPVAQQLGTPSIGHLRDILRVSRQAIDDLNCHTRFIAVSEATRGYHVAAGLRSDKCFVVYNGIDVDEFQPRLPTGFLHRELNLPPAATLIGAIGQIGLRKGSDILLDAAQSLSASQRNVHYVIVGQRYSQKRESREFEVNLHNLSKTDALRGRVHFIGKRHDVARLLCELTLLVHPARQEPLGRVLLEAAACGVPTVATDVGGTAEILGGSSPAGCLIPADNPESLASAIDDLLTCRESARRIGSAARQRVLEKFDRMRIGPILVNCYHLCRRNRAK